MDKYKLALIFENYEGGVEQFDTLEQAKAFRKGVHAACEAYGAGNYRVYFLKDAQNELSNLLGNPKNIHNFPKRIAELEKIIFDLSK